MILIGLNLPYTEHIWSNANLKKKPRDAFRQVLDAKQRRVFFIKDKSSGSAKSNGACQNRAVFRRSVFPYRYASIRANVKKNCPYHLIQCCTVKKTQGLQERTWLQKVVIKLFLLLPIGSIYGILTHIYLQNKPLMQVNIYHTSILW